MDAVLMRMNNPALNRNKSADDFVDAIITTSSEESKETVKEFFTLLRSKNISPQVKIDEADKVIARLNRSSKNLIPGNSATNRSIGNHIDPHLILENGQYVVIPAAKELGKAFNKFTGDNSYQPKSRINSDEETEYQSSSIHKNPKESYGIFSFFSSEEESSDQKTSENSESTQNTESSTTYYSPSLSIQSSEGKSD